MRGRTRWTALARGAALLPVYGRPCHWTRSRPRTRRCTCGRRLVGKVRLALSPPVKHWWHVALYVPARGLTTSPIPYGTRTFEVGCDFVDHNLLIQISDGPSKARSCCAMTTYASQPTRTRRCSPSCRAPTRRRRTGPGGIGPHWSDHSLRHDVRSGGSRHPASLGRLKSEDVVVPRYQNLV